MQISATTRALSLSLCVILTSPMAAMATAKAQYLPPIAPRVDSSVLQPVTPAVKPAPSYRQSEASNSNNGDDTTSGGTAGSDDSAADRTKALLRQALERHNQGDLAGAERLFKQVLSVDPQNSDANFNLGAMAEDHGDLQLALRYYQAAARVSPSDNDIRDAIASVQDKMRQQQQAQQTAHQLQQKQQLKQIANDAAAAYKAGKYDQAISDLQQILAKDPNDPNALFGIAQAYRGKGDRNRAHDYLNRALAIAPDNQLYQATMNDLESDMRRQNQQPQVADGGPRPAPDYGRGSRNPGYGGGGYGGNDGDGIQSFDNHDLASSGGDGLPAGGLTPYTQQGEPQLYGHAYGGGFGMGSGVGSALGMGALTAGLSGMIGRGSYYGGRGTRLVRNAAIGSLAGAAVGGLVNMHSGGFKQGALRGAVQGGLMGLIMGF